MAEGGGTSTGEFQDGNGGRNDDRRRGTTKAKEGKNAALMV